MPLCNDITKDREIRFTPSLTIPNQAEKAVQLLTDITGIKFITPVHSNAIRIRYDVREITLQMLESALTSVGFSLYDSLITRLKREIIAYCEEALRSSLGVITEDQSSLSLSKPAAYQHNLDPRPNNWRNYT